MQSGIWVIVLAAGDGHGAGHLATTPALLRGALTRAAALAPRPRIYAVVTQERRRRLQGPLWFLPRSNVLAQPAKIGTAHGILLALLRISERDPDARVVLLPSTQHALDEELFLDSLRNAAADAASKPENVILQSVEPDAADASIVVGRASALLKLFDPDTVEAMREIVERVPDAGADVASPRVFSSRCDCRTSTFIGRCSPGSTTVPVNGPCHPVQRRGSDVGSSAVCNCDGLDAHARGPCD